MRMKARIRIIIVSQRQGSLRGCVAVFLPLYGSGSLSGNHNGSQVSFTVDSPLGMMNFYGQLKNGNLTGTYTAAPAGGGAPVQTGTFNVRRESLQNLPAFDLRNCPDDDEVHSQYH
jgi:hypothetical protein